MTKEWAINPRAVHTLRSVSLPRLSAVLLFSVFLQGFPGNVARSHAQQPASAPIGQLVDEAVQYEARATSVETNIKIWAHRGLLIGTSLTLWPVAAAYGGASVLYGAYKYNKELKNVEDWDVLIR